jgi:hypothetical protein
MDERERAWISVGRESPGGAENPKGKKKVHRAFPGKAALIFRKK